MGFNRKEATTAARNMLRDDIAFTGQIWTEPQMNGYCDKVVKEISKEVPDMQKTLFPIIPDTFEIDIHETLYVLVLDGTYTDCVATDIGKQVEDDDAEVGALVAYDNTNQKWWFRANAAVANNSVMTIADSGTGAGDASGASALLMTNMVEIKKVEYTIDQTPRDFRSFSILGDTLTLELDDVPGAESTAYIYWGKLHVVDATSSTLPARYDEVLVDGITAYAVMAKAVDVSNSVNLSKEAMLEYLRLGQQNFALYKSKLRGMRPVTSGGWLSTE